MIIIPLEELCSAEPLLRGLLTDSVGLKVAEFDADLNQSPPYVCWQIIHAEGQHYLSDPSDMDEALVQIDVYSKSKAENRQIAKLLRNAISEHCYVEGFTGNERDSSNLWRIRLDTRWFEES